MTKEKPEETNKLKAEEIKKEHIEEEDNNKQIGFNSFSSFSKNDVKMEKKENEKNEKNDEMTEIIGTNRMIGDDEVRNSPSLVLEETTNKNILRGNKLVINASGLLNGNRKAKDGVAFFGRPLKKVINIIN